MPEVRDPDHQPLEVVAWRLGKSVRWLQSQLAEDLRRPPGQQRMQFHHNIGRSKRWSESEYKALGEAIASESAVRLGLKSSNVTEHGTLSEQCVWRASTVGDAQAALERVLAFRPHQRPLVRLKRYATTGPSKSATKSSTA